MRRLISTVLAMALAACSSRGPAAPYRASVDLGPSIRALGSDDVFVSEPAEERILGLGAAALPALAAALARDEPAVRRGVVALLPRVEDDAAGALLVAAARDDPDPDVRYEAFRGLAARPDERGRALVESSLGHDGPRVRLGAVLACAVLCTSGTAFARLTERAVDDVPANAAAARVALLRVLRGPDATRAGAARRAILASAVPAVTAAPTPAARLRAALLASDVGDASGREVLAAGVRDGAPGGLRLHAVYALGTVGDARAVPVLAAVGGDETLRRYARDALLRLDHRGVPGARAAVAATADGDPAPLPPPGLPY
jgi:hypothetical protein